MKIKRKIRYQIPNGECWLADCRRVMSLMKPQSVDMVFADLPYGTTSCRWDSIIDFDELWEGLHRICKPEAAMVFTAVQPFTSALVMSNPKEFRYQWTWLKNRPTNFANAKKQPLRKTEDVLVFSVLPHIYQPQGLTRIDKVAKNSRSTGGEQIFSELNGSRGKGNLRTPGSSYIQEFTGYPVNVLEIDIEKGFHPTQKPEKLLRYLIKTYSQRGGLIFDPTFGSGTTAVAAQKLGRLFLGCESDREIFFKAIERIQSA